MTTELNGSNRVLRPAVLVICTLLASCAVSKISEGLTKLEGKHIDEAIGYLGLPTGETTAGGHRTIIWSTAWSITTPKTRTASTTGTVGTTPYSGKTSYTTYEQQTLACTVRLAVNDEGVIYYWQVEGNEGGCQRYASSLKPLLKAAAIDTRPSSPSRDRAGDSKPVKEQRVDEYAHLLGPWAGIVGQYRRAHQVRMQEAGARSGSTQDVAISDSLNISATEDGGLRFEAVLGFDNLQSCSLEGVAYGKGGLFEHRANLGEGGVEAAECVLQLTPDQDVIFFDDIGGMCAILAGCGDARHLRDLVFRRN